MKSVIGTEKRPIKMWLDDIEDGALEQAKNLANLPFAFKHIPLMPDCHQGYGMPIGSILATEKVVVPNAVGVDIGCGMCAVKTELKEVTEKELKQTLSGARKTIPLGRDSHANAQDESLMPEGYEDLKLVSQGYTKALKQVGTLGGGNHFIEIQKDEEGFVWIMIHSGSRNLGYSVANFYNRKALELNEKYFSMVTKKHDLAFLPLDSQVAQDYLAEMNYCIDFALANRKLMMDRTLEAMKEVIGDFNYGNILNKSHNFAAWENHFDTNVLVHRKGATQARRGELGMIPGSQGASSYIVRGLGNPDSFKSCSHGAGRKLGRKQASRTLDLKEEIENLNRMGVVHSIRNTSDLDEAPGAYKDIVGVMSNQTDLIEVVTKLYPLAVLKG